MKLQRSVETTATPAQVFAYLSDFTTTNEWDPGTVRTEKVSGDGGVGTTYLNTSKFMGRETELTYVVQTHEPDRLFALRGENDTVIANDTMEIAPLGRGLDGHLHRRLRVQGRRRSTSRRCSAGVEEARRRGRGGPASGAGEAVNRDSLALLLGRGIDTLMDRTVAPGFTKIGPAVRRRLPGWPDDPSAGSMVGRTAAVTGATSGLGWRRPRGWRGWGRACGWSCATSPRANACWPSSVAGAGARRDGRPLRRRRPRRRTPLRGRARPRPPRRPRPQRRGDARRTSESPQGHELTMAVHVLGPVLMTELMRERLAGHDARVVLVTSGGMYGQKLRPDDPEYLTGEYSRTTAYARSKRAQVELLPVLAGRWAPQRSACTPPTPAGPTTPGVTESLPTFNKVMGPLLRDAEGGADTTVWVCATQPQPRAGQLWHDRRARSTHLLPRTRTGEPERSRCGAGSVKRSVSRPRHAGRRSAGEPSRTARPQLDRADPGAACRPDRRADPRRLPADAPVQLPLLRHRRQPSGRSTWSRSRSRLSRWD